MQARSFLRAAIITITVGAYFAALDAFAQSNIQSDAKSNAKSNVKSDTKLNAQPHTQAASKLVQREAVIAASQARLDYLSEPLPVPLTAIEPFLCVSLVAQLQNADAQNLTIWIRTSSHEPSNEDNADAWSTWTLMNDDAHAEDDGKGNTIQTASALAHRRWVSKLLFVEKDTRFVQYKTELRKTALYRAPTLQNLTVHFFSPGVTPSNAHLPALVGEDVVRQNNKGVAETQGAVPRPKFMTRTEWGCPWGQTAGPNMADLASTDVTHLIVHHSFEPGNNIADWPAAVRGVWNYHVMSNGWSDIGYNWLIDPTGKVYQGRAWIGENEDTRGAHFCGSNTNTMGVCMLGNYSQIPAPEPAVASLVQLLAYKASQRNLDPLGQSIHPASNNKVLNTISGHRDGTCSTECPGDFLYPVLPDIRTRVAAALRTTSIATPTSLVATDTRLRVAPNPASGTVTLQIDIPRAYSSVRVSVWNALGVMMTAQEAAAPQGANELTMSLETTSWPVGMYVVQVHTGTSTQVQKLVVAR
jgi:hypothetical protein